MVFVNARIAYFTAKLGRENDTIINLNNIIINVKQKLQYRKKTIASGN